MLAIGANATNTMWEKVFTGNLEDINDR
jgi:hypothetical protein